MTRTEYIQFSNCLLREIAYYSTPYFVNAESFKKHSQLPRLRKKLKDLHFAAMEEHGDDFFLELRAMNLDKKTQKIEEPIQIEKTEGDE